MKTLKSNAFFENEQHYRCTSLLLQTHSPSSVSAMDAEPMERAQSSPLPGLLPELFPGPRASRARSHSEGGGGAREKFMGFYMILWVFMLRIFLGVRGQWIQYSRGLDDEHVWSLFVEDFWTLSFS